MVTLVQDPNEAEKIQDQELHEVARNTNQEESRRPDPSYCGDPLIQDGLDSGWKEEILNGKRNHKNNKN